MDKTTEKAPHKSNCQCARCLRVRLVAAEQSNARLQERLNESANVSQHQVSRIEDLKTANKGLVEDLQKAQSRATAAEGDAGELAEQVSILRANKDLGIIGGIFIAAVVWGLIGWIVGRYGR